MKNMSQTLLTGWLLSLNMYSVRCQCHSLWPHVMKLNTFIYLLSLRMPIFCQFWSVSNMLLLLDLLIHDLVFCFTCVTITIWFLTWTKCHCFGCSKTMNLKKLSFLWICAFTSYLYFDRHLLHLHFLSYLNQLFLVFINNGIKWFSSLITSAFTYSFTRRKQI